MAGELKLREGSIEWREVEGKIVALDLVASEYVGVNDSGAAIWPLLAAGTTREQLVAHLATTFGIDGQSAAPSVDEFVATLAERGLLETG